MSDRHGTEIADVLRQHGITATDEAGLRAALDGVAPTWTLLRRAPTARRTWKAEYRLMIGATWLDTHTIAEAYTRGILWVLGQRETAPHANSSVAYGYRKAFCPDTRSRGILPPV